MAILKGALDFLRNRNSIESPTSVDTATTDSKGFIDIYKCEECDNMIKQIYPSIRHRFCSDECRLKALHRETPKKRTTGEIRICKVCDKEFYVPLWKIKIGKGIVCSPECRYKLRLSEDPVDSHFYSSSKWRNLRKIILERDNHECQECGEIENLEVHHIISINKCGDKFDTDNLITLCHSCHNAQHNRF